MKRFNDSLCVIILGACLVVSPRAFAAEPAAQIKDDEAMERIKDIEDSLNAEKTHAALWWGGWSAVYAGLAAYSFYDAAVTDDRVVQITQTVSGVQAAIGFVAVAATPMVPAYAPCVLGKMPAGTTDEKISKLGKAEYYLKESAGTQEFGRSLWAHLGNFVIAAGGAAVIALPYQDTIKREVGDPGKEALLNFLLSFIVGEIQIWTQPTKSIYRWNEYRRKYQKTVAGTPGEHPVRLVAYPANGGMAVGGAMLF